MNKIRLLLEKLGCSEINFDTFQGVERVEFMMEDRLYSAPIDEVPEDLTTGKIESSFLFFSCCGDEMRGIETDLCPTCEEHC